MMLRDQFLSICNRDLLLFLKERIPKDIQEMSVLADQYREARHANIQTLVSSSKRETFGDKNSTSKDRDKREQTTGGNAPTTKPPMRRDGRCYKCNKPGHISSQCPQRYRNSVGAAMGTNTQKEESVDKYSDIQGKCGASTSFTNTSTYSMASNSADLVNSSCNIASSFVDMPTCNGMLNEHLVTVLRDTGCNGVVVRRDLFCDD